MSTPISAITAALGGKEYHELTPTEATTFIGILAAAIVDVVLDEHSDTGGHLFRTGTYAERGTADAEGMLFIATTDSEGEDIAASPSVYGTTETETGSGVYQWVDITDLSSTRLIYSNAQFTALNTIAKALNFILGAFTEAGKVSGSQVIVVPAGSDEVVGTSVTLNEMAATIDDLLKVSPAADMPVVYGSSMSLQSALSSIKLAVTALQTPISWDADSFDHITETDTSLTAIIQRLDNAIRKVGVDYDAVSFSHTPQGGGIMGETIGTVKAMLNSVESATAAYADVTNLSAFISGAASDGWKWAWNVADDPTATGLGLGNVYLNKFYVKAFTAGAADPDNDLIVEFHKDVFNGTPSALASVTLTAPNTESKDPTTPITVSGDYCTITVRFTITGSTSTEPEDIAVGCNLVKLRNMSVSV